MRAIVIGNGLSRRKVNLSLLRPRYEIIIGCNALYREYSPDFLCAVDKPIQEEILAANYSGVVIYRHHIDLEYPSNWERRNYTKKNNSGVVAIHLAKEVGAGSIDLIGFDLGHNGATNNLYHSLPSNSFTTWASKMKELEKTILLTRIIDENCLKGVLSHEKEMNEFLNDL